VGHVQGSLHEAHQAVWCNQQDIDQSCQLLHLRNT
jgi:hypothetical protein